MPSLAEVAKIKAEIAKLESALKSCTDSQIREVIDSRLEERRHKLAQYQSLLRQQPKSR
jgi:D-mannonate dehydratase